MLMQTRPSVDFHYVERKHAEIHGRLENWARSCHGSSASSASPMFRLYRSSETINAREVSVGVDHLDAMRIAKGIVFLPTPHRLSIHWCYLKKNNPRRACQEIGTSLEGLALYIRDSRQFLINRRV